MDVSVFEVGQKVQITKTNGSVVEGTVIHVTSAVSVSASDHKFPVYINSSEIREYEIIPDYQPGDIWEVNGKEFYVREYRGVGGGVCIEAFDHKNSTTVYANKGRAYRPLSEFTSLNPKLVRRRNDSRA